MHLAWRWFTGLGFDQEIPHHSTFSKNRHGRFQESKLFEELFEQIVRQCVEVGLVQGKHLSVDGSFVEANAAKESRIPREQLAEAAQVNQTVRQYLVELEQQNPTEEPVHQQDQVSTTDPDCDLRHQGWDTGPTGVLRQLSGGQPQLRDRGSTSDGSTDESGNGSRARHAHSFHAMARTRARIGSGRHDLRERGVLAMVGGSEHHALHAHARQCPRKNSPLYGPERFTYLPESNSYRCPAGQQLNYGGLNVRNRAHAYIGTAQTLWSMCTKSAMHERTNVSILPFTSMNRPGNALATWCNTPSRRHSGKKEGGSPVRGTEESDRTASLASAEIKVCSGAVLPGSGGPEHQATRALPQPTDNTHCGSCLLAEVGTKTRPPNHRSRKDIPISDFFNTHA